MTDVEAALGATREPLSAVPVVPGEVRSRGVGDGLLLERRLAPSGPVSAFFERTLGLGREHRFELDKVGADYYRAIDGTRTLGEIARVLCERHALSAPDARKAVTDFTKTLLARGLVALRVDA